ncbi:Rpn family recombination-promoting nuclease/putative transposase [Desulfitobacterium hafniense]|uniref:Rpn family recombination-promoting nuclease/putative transposase n=1 Tax=Desulfitobacterium hafniense TaxID=49338 RepID=UPI00037F01E1|nr:Rpn family recombination-promoting nuclease/putative transposase [Desulfitobacterium hafniense]
MNTEISYHNNDVLMKVLAEQFRNKTLDVFGIKTAKIKALLPSAHPTIDAKETRSDIIFLLEDDTLLHLEFQTTACERDLKRFLYYDARLASRQERQICTFVVYSGHIEQAKERLDCGSILYQVENIYMKDYNGDQEYNRLKAKIESGQLLNETDTLKLIFLPLMKSRQQEEDLAIQAAELAKATDEKTKVFAIAALIVITDKIMSESNKRKLLEVLKMTQIEQWIREEGREEGRQEGRQEGELKGRQEEKRETARTMLSMGMSPEVIAKATKLSQEEILRIEKEMKN